MSDDEVGNKKLLEKWKKRNLDQMVEQGWKPRIIRRRNSHYLTMRFGNQERSLGPATPKNLELFLTHYPDIGAMLSSSPRQQPAPPKVLTTPIQKPTQIGRSYQPTLEVLNWYDYCCDKGFRGELGDFVNQAVHSYFKIKNWKLAVIRET